MAWQNRSSTINDEHQHQRASTFMGFNPSLFHQGVQSALNGCLGADWQLIGLHGQGTARRPRASSPGPAHLTCLAINNTALKQALRKNETLQVFSLFHRLPGSSSNDAASRSPCAPDNGGLRVVGTCFFLNDSSTLPRSCARTNAGAQVVKTASMILLATGAFLRFFFNVCKRFSNGDNFHARKQLVSSIQR